MPKTLCKDFSLEITDGAGNTEVVKYTENLLRSYDIPVNKNIKKIVLIPESNWGGDNKTTVFSFDFRN